MSPTTRRPTRLATRLGGAATLFVSLLVLASIAPATAHESDTEGHVPPNVNYGFEVIGRDLLAGVADGLYTDVWSHDGYAYVGTFQDPACTDAGVFVVDVADAIQNYGAGSESGAMVAHIKSAPNTRVNDVKVHTVGGTDVLIATQEPCGAAIPGNAPSGGSSPGQLGQGGISLYDVTDPTKPKALKKNFLEYAGVHNTFAWSDDNGSYLLGVADTFDFQDTFIVDISKPQSPELLVQTGVADWLDDGFDVGPGAQLETGTFGSINLHDVWVEEIDGVHQAVLSYWDAGFITLDVSDPANPVFLGDSDYPDPDPITGLPYEGNAHAAVFGGNGDYIFAGDEDFDPTALAVSYGGEIYEAAGAAFGPPAVDLAGDVVYAGGTGCTTADVPAATADGQVALIDRGDCFFQDKAEAAEAQGYVGYIVANNEPVGVITMGARDSGPYPTIPGVMVTQEAGQDMQAGGPVAATEQFNGWGYLHVLNNTHDTMTVPSTGRMNPDTMDVGYLGELGYYAPAETVEEEFYDPDNPIGDLTMHNVEADPSTQDVVPSYDAGPRMFVSWYSLGMRALEYRPGHFHANANGEGSYSQNVHEVGRFIAEDGSNFWGVHVDSLDVDGDGTEEQVILASDRNTGLWIFTFGCEAQGDVEGPFYCRQGTDAEG